MSKMAVFVFQELRWNKFSGVIRRYDVLGKTGTKAAPDAQPRK
jgi:hypothetical protein